MLTGFSTAIELDNADDRPEKPLSPRNAFRDNIRWMAYELLSSNEVEDTIFEFTTASDMWAFGMVIYVIASNQSSTCEECVLTIITGNRIRETTI